MTCPQHPAGERNLGCHACRQAWAETEAHRQRCEANHWLRNGYTSPAKIAELRALMKKRPPAAVSALIESMRQEYKKMQRAQP